jgi:two-component system chemotaxis sensor kinase CheA
MDDYLRDFVQETDDGITELNNALLDLENDPSDEAAMDSIFRTAHTIKGNCGAMGFTKAADLAHAIEDLLDEMRAGRVAVTPETMDEVFEGVDTLEQMVEEVKEHEEPQSDPREVIDALRAVIEDAPGPDVRIEEPTDEDIEKCLEGVSGPAQPEQRVYHVRLAVDEDDDVEGMLVLEALADAFDVLSTNPPQNVIRNEDYGTSFDAVISSAIGEADIQAALEAVDQVDDVIVTDVSGHVEEATADVEDVEVGDMEVEELLDSVSEFDDIDAMADQIEEEEAMEELEEAGTFDELEVDDDDDIEIEGLLEDEELADDDDIEESDLGEMEDLEPDDPDDANAVFKELQDEVDEVGYEELEPELEELEFDEFSDEEELSFDELMDEAETEPVESEEDLAAFDSEFDEEEGGEFDTLFQEEGGDVADDELDDVLAEAEETTAGEGEAVTFDELVEADAEELDEVATEEESAEEPADTADAAAGDMEPADSAGADDGLDFGDAFDDELDEEFDDDLGDAFDDDLEPGFEEELAGDVEVDDTAGDVEAALDDALEPPASAESDPEAVEPPTEDAEPADGDRDLGEIESIRVNVDQVDSLLNQVEELVTSRIRLQRAVDEGDLATADDELDQLETLNQRMQDTVMDVRLVPLSQVVGNLPRVVRDLSREQDKEVDFDIEGEGVELDRRILSELGDPLMHLVRNAVDHGIESPEEREAAGKSPTGELRISARRTRDRVTIEVSDDGRGLDREGIAQQALDEGLVTEEELAEMSDSEVYELVFEAGFSTAEEVTGVSGRGVGMDVVRETVQSLDGAVGVESTPGEGTTISLRVPVSVAIVRVLFVEVGDEEYGIPVKNVGEISRTTAIESVDGEEVLTHDEKVYPLMRLAEELDAPGPMAGGGLASSAERRSADRHRGPSPREDEASGNSSDGEVDGGLASGEVDSGPASGTSSDRRSDGGGMLIRMNDDVRQVALHCDRVMRQEEVVVKPYEGLLSGIPGLSGAAVLGEGDVVNILDVESL